MIVLDASVAAKWIIAEPDSAAANELLESSVQLTAPSIVRVEVTGAVLRRLRAGEYQPEHARMACDKWDALLTDRFVHLVPNEEVYPLAVDLAFATKHMLMDCLYIAAAKMLDCPLITADRVLHERGRTVYDRIELLARAA